MTQLVVETSNRFTAFLWIVGPSEYLRSAGDRGQVHFGAWSPKAGNDRLSEEGDGFFGTLEVQSWKPQTYIDPA